MLNMHPQSGPDVPSLTVMFFIIYMLASTQDIAVDGWALTMLKPGNVGYASPCEQVGLQIGQSQLCVFLTNIELLCSRSFSEQFFLQILE